MQRSSMVEMFRIQNGFYYPDICLKKEHKNLPFVIIWKLVKGLLYLGHCQGYLKANMILWIYHSCLGKILDYLYQEQSQIYFETPYYLAHC